MDADLSGSVFDSCRMIRIDLTQANFGEGQVAIPHPSKGLDHLRHESRFGEADGAIFAGATLDGS